MGPKFNSAKSESVTFSEEDKKIYETAQETLGKIDFKALQSLFEEERRRSGALGKNGFLGKNRIDLAKKDTHFSMGSAKGKNIEIDPFGTKRNIEGVFHWTDADLPNAILSVLIHEETHKSGNNKGKHPITRAIQWAKSIGTKKPITSSEGGYLRIKVQHGKEKPKEYNYFSEGVTDIIAQEIYATYIQRSGTGEIYKGSHKTPEYMSNYESSRATVTAFITKIAQAVGIPYETVWNSIKQGYFAGIDLESTDLAKEYSEMGLSETVSSLQKSRDDSTVIRGMNIDTETLSEESKDRLRKALKRYEESVHYLIKKWEKYTDHWATPTLQQELRNLDAIKETLQKNPLDDAV